MTSVVSPSSDGCTAFSRISFDRLKDTDETIKEVQAPLSAHIRARLTTFMI